MYEFKHIQDISFHARQCSPVLDTFTSFQKHDALMTYNDRSAFAPSVSLTDATLCVMQRGRVRHAGPPPHLLMHGFGDSPLRFFSAQWRERPCSAISRGSSAASQPVMNEACVRDQYYLWGITTSSISSTSSSRPEQSHVRQILMPKRVKKYIHTV